MSNITDLLQRSSNPVEVAVRLMLTWIAMSDGEVSAEERAVLGRLSPGTERAVYKEHVSDVLNGTDLAGLRIACHLLRDATDAHTKTLILQMAVGVAVADGRLSVSENHILRFLADLLGFTAERFSQLYSEATGASLPQPADLSSASVWLRAEHRSRRQSQDGPGSHEHRSHRPRRATGMTRKEALAVLGLEEGATQDEIKVAYRRLAQVHHPDRFERLGKDAVGVATQTFARIQSAFKHLSGE